MSIRRIIYLSIWALYFILVVYLSFGDFNGPGYSALFSIPHMDKVAHFFMYAILTAFGAGYIYIEGKEIRYMIIYVIFIIAIGGLIELVQPVVERGKDLYDFISNTAGVVFAVAMVYALRDLIDYIDDKTRKKGDFDFDE